MKQRELMTVDETREPPIMRARRRMDAAEIKLRDAEELHDIQGPEAYPKLVAAAVEYRRAESWLAVVEGRELARQRIRR